MLGCLPGPRRVTKCFLDQPYDDADQNAHGCPTSSVLLLRFEPTRFRLRRKHTDFKKQQEKTEYAMTALRVSATVSRWSAPGFEGCGLLMALPY
jgi:hypothetical protein